MDEVIQTSAESINEVELRWYKKLLTLIKKILLSIFRLFLSVLKIFALFFTIAMSEKFGQGLREMIRASELEYDIAHGIYTVLISILKVFVMFFVIIPFIICKFIGGISGNKK